MKREKLEKNLIKKYQEVEEEANNTSSSSLSLNETIVAMNGVGKNGAVRIESKLIENGNNTTTSSTALLDSSNLNVMLRKAALKPITITVYLLSSLFLFQLVLTTIGFYLQFNYLKTQNELNELRINSFFERVIADLNTDFNELLRQQILRKKEDEYNGKVEGGDNYMILNLTHEINLKDLNVDELNRTVLAYQQNLFDAVLRQNLNSRIKRNAAKPPSSFYHKVNYNQSGGGQSRNHRQQGGGDEFFLTDRQPKNFSGDHFLIQAYSKISVGIFNYY